MPLAGPVFRLAEKIVALGAPAAPADALAETELSALNESALDTPSQALANATREVVRVCETVEIMLKRIIELYEKADADKIKTLAALDDRVDRRHAAIKLYLAKVSARQLTEAEALRHQELIGVKTPFLIPHPFSPLPLFATPHVIRNAGGRATDDAIRSLVISHKLLGTKEWFVIHHTNCGMQLFSDEVWEIFWPTIYETASFDGQKWSNPKHGHGSAHGHFIKWHAFFRQ